MILRDNNISSKLKNALVFKYGKESVFNVLVVTSTWAGRNRVVLTLLGLLELLDQCLSWSLVLCEHG